MNRIDENYEIVVIGAGMIGSAMAIGLAKKGWKILLLEHTKPIGFDPLRIPDLRVSMINYTSVDLLKKLGAWNSVLNMRTAPYRILEIWEEEKSNVIFEANSLGLPELGYIVENSVLQLALWKQFSQYPNLTFLCPTKLVKMQYQNQQWKIILNNNQKFFVSLIIGADGARSQVRILGGIGVNGWQYSQSCLLITVKLEQLNQDIIWQQFFPSGPRAFLPLFNHWACLVWYDKATKIRELHSMSLEHLKKEIIRVFPPRLGPLEVIVKDSFPLFRHHANRYVEEGIALIGDAAHSINPLAGQGVNLGYRDVDSLLRILINAKTHLLPFYSKKTLLTYQYDRINDNKLMQTSMDFIYILFTSQVLGIKYARNLGLKLVQRLNIVKNKILKYALGL
ncbi:MAG: FAD-dependent monooxygenase [Arsenophonus sp.]